MRDAKFPGIVYVLASGGRRGGHTVYALGPNGRVNLKPEVAAAIKQQQWPGIGP